MNENTRENDLLLAQNEYAFISDTSSGTTYAVIGPRKETLTNTEQPMRFDANSSQFVRCKVADSIQKMIYADEGSYVVLTNPYFDNELITFPKKGVKVPAVELKNGKSINIQGPITFPLWPGQVAKVVPGHQLRSNQYLLVKVVNAEESKKNWKNSTIEAVEEMGGATTKTQSEFKHITGRLNIIRGNEVSFFIPPTGIEVVYDKESGSYVREALTLETLEYCILKDENGQKDYVRGPAVVFPEPTQTFVSLSKNSDNIKFKAVELNEDMGIYIKVIASYEDANGHVFTDKNGKDVIGFEAGEEIFITGKEQKIYFPRPEHAIIKYENQVIHYAIVIPEGEGRYVLDKTVGDVKTIVGPKMFLPDPRTSTVVQRVLPIKDVDLWFPSNEEAKNHNLKLLNSTTDSSNMKYANYIESDRSAKKLRSGVAGDYSTSTLTFFDGQQNLEDLASLQDAVTRKNNYTPPRTIKLNTKYDGAVNINVWPGYAIQTVSKTGERKVICGPKSIILDYNQSLEVLSFSAGNPKGTKGYVNTVYLNVKNNKVSDTVNVETKDLVNVNVSLSYKVNFEDKDQAKWFNIQNYTKFLTDHLRSIIRNEIKKFGIKEFYSNSINIIRDVVLGEKVENKDRDGKYFSENGMKIYDVEVMGVVINNNEISKSLIGSQHDKISIELAVAKEKETLQAITETELIKREKMNITSETRKIEAEHKLTELENQKKIQDVSNEIDKIRKDFVLELERLDLELTKERDTNEVEKIKSKAEIATKAYKDRMASISPNLIQAINSLGDKQLATELARNLPAATGTQGYLFGTGGMDGLNKLIAGSGLLESKLGNVIGKLNSRDDLEGNE